MRWSIVLLLPLLCACESEAEKAVRQQTLDPDAAQFRDVGSCSGDKGIWRGEVNGKNSFGAYTGFKPFFYSDGQVAYAGDSSFSPMMNRCYSDLEEQPSALDATESSIPQPTPPSAEPKPIARKAPVEPDSEPMHGPYDDEEISAATEQCWMSYCPCERGPDFGGPDQFLCDRIKAGLPVDDEVMSGAAGLRDARRQMREFNEANP